MPTEENIAEQYRFFALLYRRGPEQASNTIYALSVDYVLSSDEERKRMLNFVKRYNDLSGEHADKMVDAVAIYKGPQTGLLKIIDDILLKK